MYVSICTGIHLEETPLSLYTYRNMVVSLYTYIYTYTTVNPCFPCTEQSGAQKNKTELCCFRAAISECCV